MPADLMLCGVMTTPSKQPDLFFCLRVCNRLSFSHKQHLAFSFDLQLENKDTTGCLLLSEEVVHVNYKQLRIYPNPTAQFLNIHMEGIGSQRTEIDIFDVSGRKVSQETSQKDDSTVYIDVSHLKAGIYVVKVKMGELYYFEKFQKL